MVLQKKYLAANAVDGTKIRLSNNEFLRARNAANSADVNTFKVNASDRIEFASVPQATADASAGNDLVRFSQVQGLLEGLKPKEAVRAASTGSNVIIASELENGDALDGITLATGDRVLLMDQTDPKENGIYIVSASGAASRSSDMNASSEFPGSYTVVSQGTANQGKAFVCTVASAFALGTDNVTFVLFKSTATISGHDMISLSGTELSIDLATTSGLESTSAGNAGGQLRVKLESSNPSLEINGSNQLKVKLDAAGAIASGASGIAVQVDNTGIEINTNALRLKDDGVTKAKINADVAGLGLSQAVGGELDVNVDNSSIEISTDTLQVKALGITNAMLAGSIADSKLNTITTANKVSGSAVQLGASSGLEDSTGLKIKLEASNPSLQVSSGELGVKLGNGIEKGASGIYVDVYRHADITLAGGDITSQYYDLAVKLIPESIELIPDGGMPQRYGTDFDVDNSGSVSRVRWDSTNLPSSDLATGGAAALIAGEKLFIKGIKV